MNGHTPGPWRVKGTGRGLILRIFSGDHDDIDTEIATVFRADHLDYEANARVMAAGPELLAALKVAGDAIYASGLGKTEPFNTVLLQLAAAVAKAE
jgi:hypothetical protein